MKNLIVTAMAMGVATYMSAAANNCGDDDYSYEIKDKVVVEDVKYDTVSLVLPYAEIKDKKLRAVIDSLTVVDDNKRPVDENVFIYLYHLGDSDFAAWAITPSIPPMGRVWGIAYHNVGNLYVIFSPGMKDYLKISTSKVASMTLVTETADKIFNINYVWTGTIKEPEAKRNRNIIRLDPVKDRLSANKVTESYSNVRGVKAKTPYGVMEFSDDDNSSLILNNFAQASGLHFADSLNTRALISVCDVADGALADMMGAICQADFRNKPMTVIDIFDRNKNDLDKYIDCIATEFYLDGTSPDDAYFDKLRRLVTDKDDAQTLDRILSKIKERYNGYKSR